MALSNFPPPPHQTCVASLHVNTVDEPRLQGKAPLQRDSPRFLSRRQDEIFQANPLVPALTSSNHALARNGCSAAPFHDAAFKSNENQCCITDTFQRHLQATKVVLKPCDINLLVLFKSCAQPRRWSLEKGTLSHMAQNLVDQRCSWCPQTLKRASSPLEG